MVNKVQDFYFKKAKKEGYPARSVYKLEEADQKYRILKPGYKVLDLGCHPGSWCLYSAKVVGPSGLVVGIDLQFGKKIQRHKTRIEILKGDIMDPETIDLLAGYANPYDVVVSDMAPRTSGNKWADQQQSLELSQQAFAIAEKLLKPGGNFYCKVFEGDGYRDYFQMIREKFDFSKTVKPKSSRKESREVFALGMGYRP